MLLNDSIYTSVIGNLEMATSFLCNNVVFIVAATFSVLVVFKYCYRPPNTIDISAKIDLSAKIDISAKYVYV